MTDTTQTLTGATQLGCHTPHSQNYSRGNMPTTRQVIHYTVQNMPTKKQ